MFKGGKIPTLKLDSGNGYDKELEQAYTDFHETEKMIEWEVTNLASKVAEYLKDMDYRIFQMVMHTPYKYAFMHMEKVAPHEEGDCVVASIKYELIPIVGAPACFIANEKCIFLDVIREYMKKTGASGWEDIDAQALKEYYELEKGKILEREQKQNG